MLFPVYVIIAISIVKIFIFTCFLSYICLHLLSPSYLVNYDGNKSLYLVFVRVVSQHLEPFLEQLGQQHLDCF
jgi:hypothetical protein